MGHFPPAEYEDAYCRKAASEDDRVRRQMSLHSTWGGSLRAIWSRLRQAHNRGLIRRAAAWQASPSRSMSAVLCAILAATAALDRVDILKQQGELHDLLTQDCIADRRIAGQMGAAHSYAFVVGEVDRLESTRRRTHSAHRCIGQ